MRAGFAKQRSRVLFIHENRKNTALRISSAHGKIVLVNRTRETHKSWRKPQNTEKWTCCTAGRREACKPRLFMRPEPNNKKSPGTPGDAVKIYFFQFGPVAVLRSFGPLLELVLGLVVVVAGGSPAQRDSTMRKHRELSGHLIMLSSRSLLFSGRRLSTRLTSVIASARGYTGSDGTYHPDSR